MTHVLVVANETVDARTLRDALAARGDELQVTVVAPVNQPPRGYVVYSDTRRASARRRLDRALAELRWQGIDVHGQVAHPDPFSAAMEAVHDERVDEIVVSTFQPERSGWLRRDLVERLRKETGLPVEHVVVAQAAEVPA